MRGWLAFIVMAVPAWAHAVRAIGPVGGSSVRTAPAVSAVVPSLNLADASFFLAPVPGMHSALPSAEALRLVEHALPLEAPAVIAEITRLPSVPAEAARRIPAAAPAPAGKRGFAERIRDAAAAWSGKGETRGSGTDFSAKLDAGFDGRDPLSSYLRDDWRMPVQSAPAARYRAALKAAGSSREHEAEAELVDAAPRSEINTADGI